MRGINTRARNQDTPNIGGSEDCVSQHRFMWDLGHSYRIMSHELVLACEAAAAAAAASLTQLLRFYRVRREFSLFTNITALQVDRK